MALFDDEIEQPSEFEAEEQKQQVAPKQEAAPEQEAPKIPEKYAGKSLDEIVKMHQEAEKLIGRQAQEVGEVRKLADSLLKQQLEAKHDAQGDKIPEAVDRLVREEVFIPEEFEEYVLKNRDNGGGRSAG